MIADVYELASDPRKLDLLVTLKDGRDALLQAQVDTGASNNFMTIDMARYIQDRIGEDRLPLEDHRRKIPQRSDDVETGVEQREVDIVETFGGNRFEITHIVRLSFRAGKTRKVFENVEFKVLEGLVANSDSDELSLKRVPAENDRIDIILGAPWLTKEHVLRFDPEFVYDAPEDLEVLERFPLASEISCLDLTTSVTVSHRPASSKLLSSTRGPADPPTHLWGGKK